MAKCNVDIKIGASQAIILGGSAFTSKDGSNQYYTLRYYRPGTENSRAVYNSFFTTEDWFERFRENGPGVYELLLLPGNNAIGLLEFQEPLYNF